MRNEVYNSKVKMMKYAIREIVDVAQKLKELDTNFQIIPENIGDPIPKSWPVPPFLKTLIKEEVDRKGDKVFGYSHSRGLPSARKWVCEYSKRFSPSSELDYEYVLFTSGLGAGISAIYHMLPDEVRIIQPMPSYPTHASMESFAADSEPISYKLDPHNEWQPDMTHLEQQIQAHPEVTAILMINPNNPTGAVHSKKTVEQMVALAEKYSLFIISDEVYFRMVYNQHAFTQITEIAHNRVPLIVMRGISKDVPWPGGRCGWLEFHNIHLDKDFKNYAEAIKKRVLMEVCSVSLPQYILSGIYDHPEFEAWNKNYNSQLEENSNQIADILSRSDKLIVNRTNGAFYMLPLFKEGVLNNKQTLHIENDAVRAFIEEQVAQPNFPLDQRFTYYLLAATGICLVPASGFFSPYNGFRLTTLDRDALRREKTYTTVLKAIAEYTA